MLTKGEKRAVAALQDKRIRDERGLYVVEGDKLVREALACGCAIESVYAAPDWLAAAALDLPAERVHEVSADALRQLSAQKTPQRALAVVRRVAASWDWAAAASDPVLVLEAIQDPGNLGSVLRVAAWFGVGDVVVSPQGADPYGPKAVQGSMGALFHVRVHVRDLAPWVRDAQARSLPICATALDGANLYDAPLEARGLILFGNESSGLSDDLLGLASQRIAIPSWGPRGPGRESLNVAAAAAVVCAEMRRRGRVPGGETPGRAGRIAPGTIPGEIGGL